MNGPGPVDEGEILDWEVWVEPPPSESERTILVTLEYVGRDVPLCLPWEDD